MNFYTRVPLTSQRPRHYTRATRKLYVARRQVISIVGVHRGGLMQSSRSAVRRIHADNVETKARTKRRSGLTWETESKSNEAIRSPTKSAFRFRSLTLACRQIEREDPAKRARWTSRRNSRRVASPREPDGGTKPLGREEPRWEKRTHVRR